MSSLRSQTLSGIGWSALAKIINQASLFILTIILMRLLKPEAYGLLSMAMVIIGFAQIFNRFGFGAALVQQPHLAESHYSSTFYLNIVMGSVLATFFYLLTPVIVTFYNEPQLVLILKILVIDFVISAIGIVPRAALERNMYFDHLAKVDITATLTAGIIAVCCAAYGAGVWALVVQKLLYSFISVNLYLFSTSWRPRAIFSMRAVKDLWSYSINLTGFNIINYWARKVDDLLIGKYMPTKSLGIYTQSYTLMLLPLKQVIYVIERVIFSALSKVQKETERVKAIYLKANRILAFITFPMMTGLFVVAKPFVLVFFGPDWREMIPIIQILTWIGITQTLCNPTGWIYKSQGKTNWLFWWGVFGSGSLIVAIVIGVHFGTVKSVALSYAAASLLITYPCIAIPGKLINMKFNELVQVVFPSLLLSALMALIVYFSSWVLSELSIYLMLFIEVVTGILSYTMFAYIFNLKAYWELKKIIVDYYKNFKQKN